MNLDRSVKRARALLRLGRLRLPRLFQRDLANSPMADRERAALILARVQLVAATFAVLTAAWIVVDAIGFDGGVCLSLASGRVLASLAFVWIARRGFRVDGAAGFRRALGLLFLVPLIFYLFAAATLAGETPDIHAVWLLTAYVDLPCVLAACIAIFPLTIVESAMITGMLVAASAAVLVLSGGAFLGGFDIGHLWLVTVIAAVAASVAASQLRFLVAFVDHSSRDVLTRSLTRRFGMELLEAQFHLALRQRAPLTIAFLDLDHFKSVNDRFGHDAGDALLRGVADALRRSLRRQDSVIRWGGEEFLILLPSTGDSGARRVLERIAAHGLGTRPDGAPQTASIGLAETIRDAAETWSALVDLADQRMYRAKQAGRNRVCDGAAITMFTTEVPAAPQAPPLRRAG